MTRTSVLYDAPGPKARARNWIYTVIFVVAIVAVAWWVLHTLNSKNQLAGAKWKPFVNGDTWTEFLLPGLWSTVKAALISVVLALPFGALLGIARLSDHPWIRWPAGVIVEFFRSVPVLIMMVFAYEGYSLYEQTYEGLDAKDVPLLAVVTGLLLYNGSVLAEVFRAGILSLPRGQTEASQALGLRKSQMMRMILLPQAVTVMLPAIISQLVVVVKDTALGGQLVIGYDELLRKSSNITANDGNPVATYVVIALIYVALNFALTQLASFVEKRLRNRTQGGKPDRGAPIDTVALGLPAGPGQEPAQA